MKYPHDMLFLALTALFTLACSPVHTNLESREEPKSQKLSANFASIRDLILKPKCIECHRADSLTAASKSPLTTLAEIHNSPRELVIPGNPEESGIVIYTNPTASKKMPPPESRIPPLTPEEAKVIETWIKNGAQD
jgi:uncharacterized membrane protein